MRYGVVTARRGWLGPDDILNTLPADEFAAALQNKIMKIISSKRSLRLRPLPRHRRSRPSIRRPDSRSSAAWCATSARAVMMAVDEKKRVLLVRQYRLPAEKYLWELPAGRLDPGEKPLQAAKRELKEETGYRAQEVDASWPATSASPGFVQERMTIFLADGSDRRRSHPDGRRAHRDALVHAQGTGRDDRATARSKTARP